jgi:phosphohistidine phosphatase SixA
MTTATARQLNAAGVTEAIAIGEALKTRSIPIGRLLSSEFCRCLKTAELMQIVPTAMIEQRPEITFSVYDEANRCADSMALLAEEPADGVNTGLVSHAGFTGSCPTLGEIAWGEAAIYKPNGAGGSTFIQRVLWSEWATLP